MLISRPVTFAPCFSLVLALLLASPASAMPFGIMFESDANNIGGSELAFNTYQTFNDILDANATSSTFSDINVNAPFSTTGITWDGSQFIVMFESDANNIGGSELAFNTYQTFNDILDANATSSTFSDINVNAPFSTTGLFIEPTIGVPEPASAWLMMLAMAGLWRARKKAVGAW